jgi:AraC-like DNA-binding protein
VQSNGHLHIEPVSLAPAQEWVGQLGRWRFIKVSEGEAYWIEPSTSRALTAGELLVLPPEVQGTIRASRLTNVALHLFTFDPNLLCGFFTLEERESLKKGPEPAGLKPSFLPADHPVSLSMTAVLNAQPMVQGMVTRAENLILALKILTGFMSLPQASPEVTRSAHDRFQQLVAAMPDVALITQTPEELARLCGCTTRHFNRLFRTAFGHSPRAQRAEMRLLKARSLLQSSDESLAEIASQCGYRSRSQFISVFKRRFGMSPAEWRARAKSPAVPEKEQTCAQRH